MVKLLGNDMDGPFRNQTVQLQLPPGLKVSDLQWLSLYCRDFDIDFGNVKFWITYLSNHPQKIFISNYISHDNDNTKMPESSAELLIG